MKLLHRLTALVLLVFIIAHLGTHVTAAFGFEIYQSYFSFVRSIYRASFVELSLISLLLFQALTGLHLAAMSFQRQERRSMWSWVELISAGIFLWFITIHLAAIAMTRFYYELDTDFFWMVEFLRDGSMRPWIVAFHMLGTVSVMIHVGIGLRYFCLDMGAPCFGNWIAILFILLGAISGVVGMAAYSGVFFALP